MQPELTSLVHESSSPGPEHLPGLWSPVQGFVVFRGQAAVKFIPE